MPTTNGVGRIGIRQRPPQYLLDGYPGAALAVSMRRLNSAYAGPAIRIRRASDNTEMDINFNPTTNYVDTQQIANFCTTSMGYTTTVYDQSGNGNHLIQPIASNQTINYHAGGQYMLFAFGGTAVNKIPFTGNKAGNFNLTTPIVAGTNWTSFLAGYSPGEMAGLVTNSGYSGGVLAPHMFYTQLFINNGSVKKWYDGGNTNSGPFYNTHSIITVTNVNNDINAMINNSVMNPPYRSYSTYTPTPTSTTFTKYGGGGHVFEYIIYNTDKSSIQADIRSKMLEYYPIY
jgi:hypothetical protein